MTLVEIQAMLNSPEKERNDGKVLRQHNITFKQAILLKILFANKLKKVAKKLFQHLRPFIIFSCPSAVSYYIWFYSH